MLRRDLNNDSGADLIGTANGERLQKVLDGMGRGDYETPKKPFFDHTVQSILKYGPICGENGDKISMKTGVVKGNIYSGGLAVDERTGEIFIIRVNYVPPGGQSAWIDIYDKDFNHQKTIGMGKDYPEGMVIGYVNGVRKVAIGMETGYGVYCLPETSLLVDMSVLSPEFTQSSTNHLSQMSSYNNIVIIWNNNLSQTGRVTRGLFSIFDKTHFLSTPDPVRLSFISAPTTIGGSASSEQPAQCSKTQGSTLTPYGLTLIGGQNYDNQNSDNMAAHRLRITDVNISGEIINDYMFYPGYILNDLMMMGYTQTDGKPLRLLESEGVIYSDFHGLLAIYSSWNVEFVVKLGQKVSGKNVLDLKRYTYPQSSSKGFYTSQGWGKPVNPVTGVFMDNVDDICDYMDQFGVREYTCNTGRSIVSVGDRQFTNNTYLKVVSSDHLFFEINIWDSQEAHSQVVFFGSGANPRNWLQRTVIFGGNQLSSSSVSTIQMGPRITPQIRVLYPHINSNTSLVMINGNGQIGSITNHTTSTSFNTTSDERLKNKHGEIKDGLSVVSELINSGAVQLAAFKTEPEKILPMFLAQRTQKVVPEMVTVGSGNIDDDDFVPFSVDKSAITPYLVAAVYELTEKMRVLEERLAERDSS